MKALLSFPSNRQVPDFADAYAAEQAGALTQAAEMYKAILETNGDPRAAINLGTIAYNRKQYPTAKKFYQRATVLDPDYPTAWFNLGNALDELGSPKAVEAYGRALRIAPGYSDAHFNLAIALDKHGNHGQALKHWRAYAKVDRSGSAATWARRRIRQIVDSSRLKCVGALGNRQSCDSLSLLKHPAPDRNERRLVDGFTLLQSPERGVVDTKHLGRFPGTQLFVVTPAP